ncbi:hypothetical protein V6R21_15455 [Limibacter armeniacum]|uniref:hypothetical protein n=1 Tax=Limibacter armeniacum TaxID=466084 RepID=UPI002FE5F7CB
MASIQSKYLKIEYLIIAFLWLCVLISYSIALLTDYVLYTSNYLGFIGLSITTLIVIKFPEKKTVSTLILLILGVFDLLSFIYFFNTIFSISIAKRVSIEFQELSFCLLLILLFSRKEKVILIVRSLLKTTPKDIAEQSNSMHNRFKTKFQMLTDKEIEDRLCNDLTFEAREALLEIQRERKELVK